MATWEEAVHAISAADEGHQLGNRPRFLHLSAVPIVVVGSPGTGKSAIWSRLTGRPVREAMSRHTEVGLTRLNELNNVPGSYT